MAGAQLQVSQRTLAEQYFSGFLIKTAEKKRLQVGRSTDLLTRDHLPDGGAWGGTGLVETTVERTLFQTSVECLGSLQHQIPCPNRFLCQMR
jgi:hypothetical protein